MTALHFTMPMPMVPANHDMPVPCYSYGGDPTDLSVQVDSLARFAETVVAKLED